MEKIVPPIHPQLVTIRDLSEEDIPFVRNYWFHSPPGYLEAMGVDPKKFPSEIEFEKGLMEKCRDAGRTSVSKLNAVAILYESRAIGFHTINPLIEGDFGIFHAHIWDAGMRKKGIAGLSYPLACRLFMNRFDLQRILFKTPAQNTGSIRVKEKLGIRYIGEEIIGFGIVKDGTRAKVFELTKAEADSMYSGTVDLSQLQRNLNMTVEDRLIEHQNSLDLFFELAEAGNRLREKSQ